MNNQHAAKHTYKTDRTDEQQSVQTTGKANKLTDTQLVAEAVGDVPAAELTVHGSTGWVILVGQVQLDRPVRWGQVLLASVLEPGDR